MKHRTLQPVDQHPGSRARRRRRAHEGRRSLRRLGENLVARKLDSAIQGIVRKEKYATAQIIAIRIAHELAGPLRDVERHITCLEQFRDGSPDIRRVLANLRADTRTILIRILALLDIEPPSAFHGEGAAGPMSRSRLVTLLPHRSVASPVPHTHEEVEMAIVATMPGFETSGQVLAGATPILTDGRNRTPRVSRTARAPPAIE